MNPERISGGVLTGGKEQTELASTEFESDCRSLDEAWQTYQSSLERFRAWLLSQPYADQPIARAQAQHLVQQIQGMSWTLYGASRVQFPLIRMQTYFAPMVYSWAFPNSDFLYSHAFLDGRRNYRISGKLGTARVFNSITYHSSFWGDQEKTAFSQDYAAFDFADAEGRIEILLGPEVSGPNTIRLDPDHHNLVLYFREAMADWANETPMQVAIEALDAPDRFSMVADEAEMANRILRCARFIDYNRTFMTNHWGIAFRDDERNVFHSWGYSPQKSRELHGNPSAQYHYIGYECGEDEALVIDMEDPRCPYWGMQMGDLWFQASEYSFHQASLNGSQAIQAPDGHVRMVIAHRDPGVPNWLDTVAPVPGIGLLRTYGADHEVLGPKVTRTSLARLREHLAPGTPEVTPAQRRAALKERARLSLARYGHFPEGTL